MDNCKLSKAPCQSERALLLVASYYSIVAGGNEEENSRARVVQGVDLWFSSRNPKKARGFDFVWDAS
jgi:hypothetical protein